MVDSCWSAGVLCLCQQLRSSTSLEQNLCTHVLTCQQQEWGLRANAGAPFLSLFQQGCCSDGGLLAPDKCKWTFAAKTPRPFHAAYCMIVISAVSEAHWSATAQSLALSSRERLGMLMSRALMNPTSCTSAYRAAYVSYRPFYTASMCNTIIKPCFNGRSSRFLQG